MVLAEVIGHGDAFTGTLSTVPIAKTALAMSLQRVAVSVRLSSFPLLLLLVQAPRDEGVSPWSPLRTSLRCRYRYRVDVDVVVVVHVVHVVGKVFW